MKRETKAEPAPAKVSRKHADIDEKCSVCGIATGLACPDCEGITPLCANCRCPICNPAPAQSGQHTPDYTGYGSTIRALQAMGYSLGSNNSLWWLHGGDHIATRNGQTVVVADMITNLLEEKAELIEALRELLTSEESPHSETVRFLAREQARTILAKIGGKQ